MCSACRSSAYRTPAHIVRYLSLGRGGNGVEREGNIGIFFLEEREVDEAVVRGISGEREREKERERESACEVVFNIGGLA